MSQSRRTGAAGGLESPTRRGTRLNVKREGEDRKNHERACVRPGCSRKRGRGRSDKRYCSEGCRWKARDEKLLRLRQSDFETLLEERACPECREDLSEAVGIKR